MQNARKIEQRSDEPEVYTGEIALPGTGFKIPVRRDVAERMGAYVGKHVVMGIRPEHFHVQPSEKAQSTKVQAKILVIEPLGNDMDAYIDTALHTHKVIRVEATPNIQAGQSLELFVDPEKVHIFEPGVVGKNLSLPR